MGFSYVIEHMEEDEPEGHSLPEWVKLEYSHMQHVAGPSSKVMFTNLSESSAKELSAIFVTTDPTELKLAHRRAEATATRTGVEKLMAEKAVSPSKVCLLDPKAEAELSPTDGEGTFEWFLFGGILGDDPPQDRTSELRKLRFPSRHLGSVQMTTDTAVAVTKRVVEDRVYLKDIPHTDFPTISFGPKESVEMPFRYIVVDGNPLMPPGMRDHIRRDMDKSFDFADGIPLDEFAESEKI